MRTDVKYRFSIVNFSKSDSLYNCGMKPVRIFHSMLFNSYSTSRWTFQVLYSKIEADRHFVGWTRVGDNIRYYKNDQIQAGVFFLFTNISWNTENMPK